MSPKSIIPIQKVDSLSEQRQEIEDRIRFRAYERFLQRGRQHGRESEDWYAASSELIAQPPIALSETVSNLVVLFFMPDADVGDLELLVSDHAIIVRGGLHPPVDIPGVVHIREFYSRQVFRFVGLPRAIDPSAIAVKYEEGILRVTLPLAGYVTPKPKPRPQAKRRVKPKPRTGHGRLSNS